MTDFFNVSKALFFVYFIDFFVNRNGSFLSATVQY